MKLTKATASSFSFAVLAFFCILNLPTLLGYIGITSLNIVSLVLSVFLLILLKSYAKTIYQLRLYLFFFAAYLLIGLLAIVVKSTVIGIDVASSIKSILIGIIILIATYQYICNISQEAYMSALKLIAFITLLGVLSIIFSTPLGLDNLTRISGEDYTRKSGVYLNANIGGFTAMTLMSFAFAGHFKNKFINMLLFGAALLAVLMGASKTSFITLAGLILIFFSKYNIKNINIKSVIAVVAISGLTYVMLQSFLIGDNYDRVMQLSKLAHGDTSSDVTSSRIDLAKAAIGIISDNILMGEGLYYFTLLPAQVTHLGYDLGVHNTYLLILGDSGFFPFLLFLSMLISCIKTSYKYSANHFMCYFFVAYAFYATVNHNLLDNTFVAFFLGFSMASLARLKNSEQPVNDNEQL